jgi:hypothetical protein
MDEKVRQKVFLNLSPALLFILFKFLC